MFAWAPLAPLFEHRAHCIRHTKLLTTRSMNTIGDVRLQRNTCVLATFIFSSDDRYYIEEKNEPHLRTRVGMEASCRWEARHTFAAFDVPVPGSCALDVHFTIRSTDSLNPYPEQCRISLKVSFFGGGKKMS